jgi:hypothetical protein
MPEEKVMKMEETPSMNPDHYEPQEELPPWGTIWTQPPTLLPGPENHPFFTALWADELPKIPKLAESPELLQEPTSTSSDESVQSWRHRNPSLPPAVDSFGPPMVYPFIPAPTLSMLPITPESELEQKAAEVGSAVSPPISTPGLSMSSTNLDSSPRSRPSTSNGEHQMETAAIDTEQVATSEHKTKTEYPFDDVTESSEAIFCHNTYMRALPNETTSEPAVILDGQIWRSSHKKKKGWRRNQWVVEVR